MATSSAAMRLYKRLYRAALRAFPERHRAAYAAEMIDTFERELLERRDHGGLPGATRFVLAACADVIAAGLGERRRHRRVAYTNVLFSGLDFILAWRMMLRYPGLSIVAVFGMAVGIAIAAGAFTIVSALTDAKLPLPEGDRIVSLLNSDAVTGNRDLRMLHDFTAWRGMTSVEDIGVTRTVQRLIGITVTIVMLSVIVLAAAGMYALMSFTVAQRRREIGIRAALGADRHRLLAGIFACALGQITAGVVVGLVGAFALEAVFEGEMFQGREAVLVPLVILVMAIVGTIAVAGPARRGLSIQPTEALREE